MSPAALGVDVGGTQIKWAVVDMDGRALATGARPTPQTGELDVVAAVVGVAGDVRRMHGSFDHLGVAVPGHVSQTDQRTAIVPNLPGNWWGFPLGDRLLQGLGRRPVVINDARAFAHAELETGAARGWSDVLFLAVGTGVGGAIALGGTVLHGPLGRVGEIGHITVVPNGPRCGCDNLGCAEAVAGGSALVLRARELAPERDWTSDPEAIWTAASTDEPLAARLVAEATQALATATASAAALLGIASVVVGGGIGQRWPGYAQAIRDRLETRRQLIGTARVATARHGVHAGAIGAALAARTQAGSDRPPHW